MPTSVNRVFSHARRFGLGVLLLALPACGLSDYEALTRETQEREERFRTEQKYLDEPVQMPMEKDKEGHDKPVANVFFRPPKGIGAKPDAEPIDELIWRYRARTKGGDFASVEMAFNTENMDPKDFVAKVFRNYDTAEEPKTPNREPPLPFDSWEYDGTQYGCSINVWKGGSKQVAVVFVFGKGRRNALRTAIDLSLQSFAVDQQALAARQKYNQKSPWRLKSKPAP
jgi:hypothetical protein